MKNNRSQAVDEPARREVNYRLSKWILTNIEQLLEPDEIEAIWAELLSFYSPWSSSVENVCGTLTEDPLEAAVRFIGSGCPSPVWQHTRLSPCRGLCSRIYGRGRTKEFFRCPEGLL